MHTDYNYFLLKHKIFLWYFIQVSKKIHPNNEKSKAKNSVNPISDLYLNNKFLLFSKKHPLLKCLFCLTTWQMLVHSNTNAVRKNRSMQMFNFNYLLLMKTNKDICHNYLHNTRKICREQN